MNQNQNTKSNFDLDERTFQFAKKVRDYVKLLPWTISNIEYGKQLIRSAGSVAANYIEASEALSKKDFLMRIKISRKEAKESVLWLRLAISNSNQEKEKGKLIDEANQLTRIFGSIVTK